MSWADGRGTKSWFGSWVLSSKSSAFPRSAIGLAIVLHSAGPFTPPKLRLSDIRTYNVPFQLILLADWVAACAYKCGSR